MSDVVTNNNFSEKRATMRLLRSPMLEVMYAFTKTHRLASDTCGAAREPEPLCDAEPPRAASAIASVPHR